MPFDEIEQDDTADYTHPNEPQQRLAVKCHHCGGQFPNATVTQPARRLNDCDRRGQGVPGFQVLVTVPARRLNDCDEGSQQ